MFAILLLFIAPILARAALYAMSDDPRSWRDADWSSSGLLPAAADSAPARVIIFTGTAGAWKGIFSVHSWVVLKHANEPHWQRYDVVGWGQPIRLNNWPVDGKWYGNKPVMLADISGPEAEKLIPRIEATVKDYNYSQTGDYRIWPGPNSNSFIAAILRTVPELGLALPPNAVGRDFRYGFYAGRTDSGTGFEINLHGLAGLKLGWVEGVEVNLMGLVAGLDLASPGREVAGLRTDWHRSARYNRAGSLNSAVKSGNAEIKPAFLMWRLRLAYFLGADQRRLAQRYVPTEH